MYILRIFPAEMLKYDIVIHICNARQEANTTM